MKFGFISDLLIFDVTTCPSLLNCYANWECLTCCVLTPARDHISVQLSFLCKDRSQFCVKAQEHGIIFLTSSALRSSLLWNRFVGKPPACVAFFVVEFQQRQQVWFAQARRADKRYAQIGQFLHGCLLACVLRYPDLNELCSSPCNLK